MIVSGFREIKGNYEAKVRYLFSQSKKQIPQEKYEHYDYTPSLFNKRVEATINGINTVKTQLHGTCSDSVLEAYFAFSNMMVMRGGYNEAVDYMNCASLSAAIWILDQLTLAGKMNECYQYLPEIAYDDYEEKILAPIVNHPIYDYHLILSVVKLIRQRNNSKHYGKKEIGTILCEAEKRGTDEESVKNRKSFDAVIGLIDKQAIEKAVKKYEDDVWEFYRLSFSVFQFLEERISKLETELDEITNIYPNNIHSANGPVLLPFASNKSVAGRMNNIFENRDSRIDAIEEEIEKLSNITLTELSLVNDREKAIRRLRRIIPKSLSEEVLHFRVEDPFETAFALMYLLDTDSSLPWYYYGSISVAYTMCDQMPYDVPFDVKIMDCNNPVQVSGLGDILYLHKYKGYRWTDITDASDEVVEREKAKNLSQMLFLLSGTLIPRIIPQESILNGFFDDIGDLSEREKKVLSLLVFTLNSGHLRDEGYTLYRIEKELELNEAKEQWDEENWSETIESIETLSTENKNLKDKNSQLTALLKESLQQNKKDKNELDILSKEYGHQRKELADLREKIFLLTHEDITEESNNTVVEYPYKVPFKIVSFGGHASWINEMKKKLPNVEFVPPDVLPNIDLIRGADEVWIQTNCISHRDYYRIINTLKNNDKQIRYFVYNGVGKCAEQIVNAYETRKER